MASRAPSPCILQDAQILIGPPAGYGWLEVSEFNKNQ